MPLSNSICERVLRKTAEIFRLICSWELFCSRKNHLPRQSNIWKQRMKCCQATTGYPSPALVLAQIYEREGNRQSRLQWLEVLMENLQHDYGSAMVLAQAALEDSDFERAAYFLDRAIQVDPYRSEVHELKARYAETVNDSAAAVTEYEVLMQLEISDPVEARTNLAQAYLNNGQASKPNKICCMPWNRRPVMSAHNVCCCVRSRGTAAGDKGAPSRYGESDRFAGAWCSGDAAIRQ